MKQREAQAGRGEHGAADDAVGDIFTGSSSEQTPDSTEERSVFLFMGGSRKVES